MTNPVTPGPDPLTPEQMTNDQLVQAFNESRDRLQDDAVTTDNRQEAAWLGHLGYVLGSRGIDIPDDPTP